MAGASNPLESRKEEKMQRGHTSGSIRGSGERCPQASRGGRLVVSGLGVYGWCGFADLSLGDPIRIQACLLLEQRRISFLCALWMLLATCGRTRGRIECCAEGCRRTRDAGWCTQRIGLSRLPGLPRLSGLRHQKHSRRNIHVVRLLVEFQVQAHLAFHTFVEQKVLRRLLHHPLPLCAQILHYLQQVQMRQFVRCLRLR